MLIKKVSYMSHYITVLTDTCEIEKSTYIIHTSIWQSTYRIKVFKDSILIDSVESTIEAPTQALFHTAYQEAHKKMRVKYCLSSVKIQHDSKNKSLKDLPKHQTISSNILKILLVTIAIGLLFIFWYFTVFRYSSVYIHMFHAEDQKAYMEKIEMHTHSLEKACLALSKKSKIEDALFSTDQCMLWCKKKQIAEESCLLITAYIKQNYPEKIKGIKENNHTKSLNYTIIPEGSLRLEIKKYTTLQINNLKDSPLKVYVSNLKLYKHKHEEIVQFKDGMSQYILDKNELGKFSIFLESSYYNQFKAGSYEGEIELTVIQGQRQDKVIKQFTFMVE